MEPGGFCHREAPQDPPGRARILPQDRPVAGFGALLTPAAGTAYLQPLTSNLHSPPMSLLLSKQTGSSPSSRQALMAHSPLLPPPMTATRLAMPPCATQPQPGPLVAWLYGARRRGGASPALTPPTEPQGRLPALGSLRMLRFSGRDLGQEPPRRTLGVPRGGGHLGGLPGAGQGAAQPRGVHAGKSNIALNFYLQDYRDQHGPAYAEHRWYPVGG